MLAQLKEGPGRTGQMQKLQDVHEAYQVLTKVIINSKQPIIKIPMKRSKWKKHCTQKIFNIDSKRGPSPPSPQLWPGGACEEPDQESNWGEESGRDHRGGGGHLQTQDPGHQAQYALSK